MSSLDLEKNQIRKVVKNIENLCKNAQVYSRDRTYIESFSNILKYFSENLTKAVDSKLDFLSNIEPVEIASQNLVELRIVLEYIHNDLHLLLEESVKIPREIYYLIDFFLDQLGLKVDYILRFGPQLAMAEFFSDYLKYTYKLDSILPELFYGNKETGFYIIYIPPALASTKETSKWPLIIHEISHAIDREQRITDDKLKHPEYPEDYGTAFTIVLHQGVFQEELVEKARQKLYAYEYVADLLTTYYFGPIYAEILLEEFPHLYLLRHPEPTHPELSRRISFMLNEISNYLEFKNETTFIKNSLEKLASIISVREILNEIPAMKDILESIRSLNETRIFNTKYLHEQLKNYFTKPLLNSFDSLIFIEKSLIEGKPCIVCPQILFHAYLYCLTNEKFLEWKEKKIEEISKSLNIHPNDFEDVLEELMADSIRLFVVKYLYKKYSPGFK
jgi:hypothetical protein